MGFAIAGGAALAGALISANASQGAADTQANAANRAADLQNQQHQMSRQDMQPYLQSGVNGLNQLNQRLPELTRNFSLADFQQDPGYQFNLQQGQQAIERSAAARGGGIGGTGTMKGLMDYSQGLASNEYQNAYNRFTNNQNNTFNRLMGVATNGQAAVQANGQLGAQAANNIGQSIQGAANANAAGQVGQANAINNAIGGVNNMWMQQQMLNRFPMANANGGYGNSYTSPTSGWNPQQLTMPEMG